MKQQILSILPGDHPWQNTLYCYEQVTSTNDLAKTMAREGAPNGTVVVAASQTAGRGRLGRQFYAPEGLGLYFSLILRPNCSPEQILHLTCAAGVAACNAAEAAAGIRPRIKWTNDLVIGKQKAGGILTELSVNRSGLVEWAVIGIGINCLQKSAADFPPDICQVATSLLLQTGKVVSPAQLAGHLMQALYPICQNLIAEKVSIMNQYRMDCMTVGQQVVLLRGDEKRYGTALAIDDQGGLVVQFEDGSTESVQTGEISVRGMYGYV